LSLQFSIYEILKPWRLINSIQSVKHQNAALALGFRSTNK